MLKDIVEHVVENHLINRVNELGGLTLKLVARRGQPDRLVLLPGGRFAFLELKRPKGGKVSRHQIKWLAELRLRGAEAGLAASIDAVDEALADLSK